MGLGFQVNGFECKAHWSYTGFIEFRRRIAMLIGLDLDEMAGFGKKHPIDVGYVKIGTKSWNTVKSSFKILLSHPDDKGYISSEDCRLLYQEFMRVLDFWESLEIFDELEIKNIHFLLDAIEYCDKNNRRLNFV